MVLGTRRFWLGALVCALMFSIPNSAFAQTSPQLMRLGMVKLKSGGQYDYEEASKLINAAYRKSGVPWRQVWQTAIFGEMGTMVTVTPVKNYAQFDEGSVLAQMSATDRTKYTTLSRNSIESVQYSLVETLPGLSIVSDRTTPPKFARVTTVVVQPGKNLEFEDLVKTMILPAMKKASVKDYWLNRTVLGGPMGEYSILFIFDKWAELDSAPTLQKALGPEGYKQFMGKISTIVARSDNMVAATQASMSYSQ
jgi:hypothetical protein